MLKGSQLSSTGQVQYNGRDRLMNTFWRKINTHDFYKMGHEDYYEEEEEEENGLIKQQTGESYEDEDEYEKRSDQKQHTHSDGSSDEDEGSEEGSEEGNEDDSEEGSEEYDNQEQYGSEGEEELVADQTSNIQRKNNTYDEEYFNLKNRDSLYKVVEVNSDDEKEDQ